MSWHASEFGAEWKVIFVMQGRHRNLEPSEQSVYITNHVILYIYIFYISNSPGSSIVGDWSPTWILLPFFGTYSFGFLLYLLFVWLSYWRGCVLFFWLSYWHQLFFWLSYWHSCTAAEFSLYCYLLFHDAVADRDRLLRNASTFAIAAPLKGASPANVF